MTNGIPPEAPNYSFSPKTMLAALKRNFPDRAPGRGTTYEEIMFQAGQVSVVRFIEAELNRDDSEFNQHPF